MSDRKELLDVMMDAIGHALANVHTSTIASVTAVGAKTISCRPVVNRVVNGVSIQLPEFVDVPVLVMQGGGSYTAYPLAVGDYALLIFTERCFDRWWGGQDYQLPPELRMHDYSDGIAIVGINPLAGALAIPTTIKQVGDTVQIGNYTHTGNMTRTGNSTLTGNVTLNGAYTQTGDMEVTGDVTFTGNVLVNGNLTCTGLIAAGGFGGLSGGAMTSSVDIQTTGDVVAGTVHLKTHTHPVTTAPGTTGVPT
jgi:cytoskeletal protein CcmA (bactofilin family)